MTYTPLPSIAHLPDGDPEIARIAHGWLTEHPAHHDQNTWADRDGSGHSTALKVDKDGRAMHCGTTCCVAGLVALMDGWNWSEAAGGGNIEGGNITDHAGTRLGLTSDEGADLFYNFNNESSLRFLAAIGERE